MTRPTTLIGLGFAALAAALLSMFAGTQGLTPVQFALGTSMLLTPWFAALWLGAATLHLLRAVRRPAL